MILNTKDGYVCIIEKEKVFEERKIKDFLNNVFNELRNYFIFFMFKKKELLKVTTWIEKEDLNYCFIGSINDYDNDSWIFALNKNCMKTVEFKNCKYLECFLKSGIAIFTQYDSDGIEFQIHKDDKELLQLLKSVLKKVKQ